MQEIDAANQAEEPQQNAPAPPEQCQAAERDREQRRQQHGRTGKQDRRNHGEKWLHESHQTMVSTAVRIAMRAF